MKQIIKTELLNICNTLKETEFKNLNTDAISFEINYGTSFGDYSSNICFSISKQINMSPKVVAEKIINLFSQKQYFSEVFEKNNFLNFNINRDFLNKYILSFPKNKISYPKTNKKIQVEFVSANPTGPLTIANARGAFYGNALANILKFTGNTVVKEYYVNNKGNQICHLGISLLKILNIDPQVDYNEDNLYKGDHLIELAKEVKDAAQRYENKIKKLTDIDENTKKTLIEITIGRLAAETNLQKIKKVLENQCGIHFDNYFFESSLWTADTFNFLLKEKLIYEKDGAFFLKTTLFNDDKDRVVTRSDNTHTYFFTDIVYHLNKFGAKNLKTIADNTSESQKKFVNRKFDKVIDIFGADHYSEANQLKTMMEFFKSKQVIDLSSHLDILLMQFLTLQGGEKMSKRKGNFNTLEDFVKTASLDAANFFILERSIDKHLVFDINLAKEQSEKNPVFYTQYAYARICSILKKNFFKFNIYKNLDILQEPEEIKLMKLIIKLPDLIEEVSNNYQIHLLTSYLIELSKAFHAFYTNHNILKSNFKLKQARLNLIKAVKTAYEICFKLINIKPKQKM
jgi:arginyl-tRNA synthetase